MSKLAPTLVFSVIALTAPFALADVPPDDPKLDMPAEAETEEGGDKDESKGCAVESHGDAGLAGLALAALALGAGLRRRR